jgi:hypothetical protein
VARIVEGVLHLDQQRLQSDPQLQGGLAVAAGVEVGPGAQQEGLAGVGLFAAAEHGSDPFLGPQLLFAALPSRGGAGAGVDLTRPAEASGRGFLAAGVADQDPLGPLRGQAAARARVGAGQGLCVQSAVEQAEALLDEDVDGVLGLAGFVQPAGGRLLVLEGAEGTDRRRPGEDQRPGLVPLLGLARPAPATTAGDRGADPLQDEDALLAGAGVAGQVAAVGQRQGAGEIELQESE